MLSGKVLALIDTQVSSCFNGLQLYKYIISCHATFIQSLKSCQILVQIDKFIKSEFHVFSANIDSMLGNSEKGLVYNK